MDVFFDGVLLTIIALLCTWMIHQSRKNGWDVKVNKQIEQYEWIFEIAGTVIKKIDEDLYANMEDVLAALHDMTERENVCKEDVQILLDEAKDVFDDVVRLYQEVSND